MIKSIGRQVWAFDAEWIPDPAAGRALLGLKDGISDRKVMQGLWEAYGATEDDPRPYLKTILCRVVSISAVIRKAASGDAVSLKLWSLPQDVNEKEDCTEQAIIHRFLSGIGKHKPQLVGYNSVNADLRILVQRGVVNGLQAEEFCKRPAKPWEGPDYFARDNEIHIDLMNVLSAWTKPAPSLHEAAVLSGIPGKMAVDGDQVADLWLSGKLDEIVAYNECDAVTTYLLWLRLIHFAGLLTTDQYDEEQSRVEELLEELQGDRAHLKEYLQLWRRLRAR